MRRNWGSPSVDGNRRDAGARRLYRGATNPLADPGQGHLSDPFASLLVWVLNLGNNIIPWRKPLFIIICVL
jgi:hypothetical protein